ncbi:MAG: hypothetical protein GY790_15115 [Bacteroidetes bacterium]|nr:hypothetical protein [Bacteroidota bacterium]
MLWHNDIEEWFPDKTGIRCRADAPPKNFTTKGTLEGGTNPNWGDGTAALNYLGDTIENYQKYYTLKDSDLENPWNSLLMVCDILNNTNPTVVYDSLSQVMDVEATLWYLAQEIVFSDDDSYVYKGKMDYYLFWEEASQRFVPLEFDGNSAMNSRNREWSPFMNEDIPSYPLLHVLLAVPELRQRYIAHVKTILAITFENGLAMEMINTYKQLITPILENDPKIDFDMAGHGRAWQGMPGMLPA